MSTSTPSWYTRVLRVVTPRMTGNDVRAVEALLYRTPYGVYGRLVSDAVALFQGQHGLLVDGIVGPATAAVLGGAAAPAPTPPPPPPSPPGPVPPPVPAPAGMQAYAAYPGNTGPRSTPTVNKSGRVVISSPGTYSGFNVVAGNVDIQSNGGPVIFEDFIIDSRGMPAPGPAGPLFAHPGFTSPVEIRYGRVIGAGNRGSTAMAAMSPGCYAHHVDISNSEDGIRVPQKSTGEISYCWVHNLTYIAPVTVGGVFKDGTHNDCIQYIGNETHIETHHNRLDAPYKMPNCCLFCKADVGNIDDINQHHNWLHGGGYSAYVYDAAFKSTNVKLDYNVWIRGSATYGPLAVVGPGLTSKVGNAWDDGSLIWG